jgi:hypothetical protein
VARTEKQKTKKERKNEERCGCSCDKRIRAVTNKQKKTNETPSHKFKKKKNTKQKTDIVAWLMAGSWSIGRKECNIVLPEDKSISRRHAMISVQFPKTKQELKDVSCLPEITLLDESKFGTFIGGEKCSKTEPTRLKREDVIKFGINNSVYLLKNLPMAFCCSSMKQETKNTTRDYITKIGGHLVDDWKQCTHLVMTEIKVTTKVCSSNSFFSFCVAFLAYFVAAVNSGIG